jgi:hypothetical protein
MELTNEEDMKITSYKIEEDSIKYHYKRKKAKSQYFVHSTKFL